MKCMISTAGAVLLCAALTVAAQTRPVTAELLGAEPAPRELSLDDALQLARENGHQVRQAQLEVQKTGLATSEARRGRLPTLSIETSYTNNIQRPAIFLPSIGPFDGSAIRTGSRHNVSSSLQASMPVYSPQITRTVSLRETAARLERALHDATVRDVEVEVQRAFVNGLMTHAAFVVIEQSHDRLRRNLALVEALYADGMAPEYDLIRTEVQAANVEPELVRARTNHQGALNYVKLLTGLPIDADIVLDGTLDAIYGELPSLPREPRFDRNRDVLQAEGQMALANEQLALERAAYLPTLSAIGNVTYQSQQNHAWIWDYDWLNTSFIGLRLSIPLYSGGRSRGVEQVQVQRRQLALQRAFLLSSLESEYQIAMRRMAELERSIAAQARNVGQAERGYAIARTSYEQGAHSLMDLNDAEQALTDARLNHQAAMADYINATLDIAQLLGRSWLDAAGAPEWPR
jgi:outer membrane protein